MERSPNWEAETERPALRNWYIAAGYEVVKMIGGAGKRTARMKQGTGRSAAIGIKPLQRRARQRGCGLGRASTSNAVTWSFFWRPFLCGGCARVQADDDAVRAACSHTAMAAFLGCRTDKNNETGSLRREGREGILIVDRCIAGVKPEGPISVTRMLRVRGGIRAPIRVGGGRFTSVIEWRRVGNA